MDGVLVDTEHLWDEVREELTDEWGGRYTPEAQQAMMGMSSHEWSRYLHEVVGLREPPDVINGEVVRRMLARYEVDLPVVPGAVEAVRRTRGRGLPARARVVLEPRADRHRASPARADGAVRSRRCRPRRSPAASRRPTSTSRRHGVSASTQRRCAAVEDSASGIRAAHAAGMRVIAYPNRHYPPTGEVLALGDVVTKSMWRLVCDARTPMTFPSDALSGVALQQSAASLSGGRPKPRANRNLVRATLVALGFGCSTALRSRSRSPDHDAPDTQPRRAAGSMSYGRHGPAVDFVAYASFNGIAAGLGLRDRGGRGADGIAQRACS